MGMKEEVMGLAEEVEATVGGCVRCIADKPGGRCLSEDTFECSDAICREVAKRLRAIVEHGAEDVSVSAYDLLSDEDRETLAWVREHGGIDAVEKRLMPAGMEWPKYTDGELVRIGGCWGEDGCDTSITYIERIIFAEDGVYLDNEYNEAFYRHGERVKRPEHTVLAADGEPLEAGQTVWDVESGTEYEVVGIHTDEDTPVRVMRTDGSHLAKAAKPSTLTHERPVLDADGVPIKKGDTVWHKAKDTKYRVFRFSAVENCVWGESDLGFFLLDCSMLTHAKPEQDTWERIEADCSKFCIEYCDEHGLLDSGCNAAEGDASTRHCTDCGDSCEERMARDLVRRARKLAERGA